MVTEAKDADKARAGRIGASRRWGPKRVVRLTDLHPTVAEAIRALVAADEAAKAAEGGQT